ncbi:MAG: type II secretion system protein [Vulcanimicrobiota bacterium]
MKRSGMTFVEMIIYTALTGVVMALVGSLFKLAKSSSQTADANYFLNADAETCVSWLRRDLQQCALASIQNFPTASNKSQAPGISLCSALEENNPARIYANDQGNPYWSNHVYYTLQPLKGNTGKLVRWTAPTNVDPSKQVDTIALAPLLPSQISSKSARTIHSRVLMPNQELWGVANPDGKIDEHGGFALRYVRQDASGVETLSDDSPRVFSAKGGQEYKNNTRLLELELKFFTDNSTGKPSFYSLRFRVCPNY